MKIIKVACVCLLIHSGTACSNEPLTIKGEVVDESGVPLSNVDVRACYSGWGITKGNLVWDKDYCSETTQTNHEGLYVISFNGPASSRLRASKAGWVQIKDYNTTQSHIVLARSADYASRLKAETMQRKLENRQSLPNESGTDYYCRVILPEIRPINVSYRDETISITPVFLENGLQYKTIFAVDGSTRVMNSLSEEVEIRINGEIPDSKVSFDSTGKKSCRPDIHFIGVDFPSGLPVLLDMRVEIFIPSINAMFDMKIWII